MCITAFKYQVWFKTGKHLNGSPVPPFPIAWRMPDLFLWGGRGLEKQHTRCTGAVIIVPPKASSKPVFAYLSLETGSY